MNVKCLFKSKIYRTFMIALQYKRYVSNSIEIIKKHLLFEYAAI